MQAVAAFPAAESHTPRIHPVRASSRPAQLKSGSRDWAFFEGVHAVGGGANGKAGLFFKLKTHQLNQFGIIVHHQNLFPHYPLFTTIMPQFKGGERLQ